MALSPRTQMLITSPQHSGHPPLPPGEGWGEGGGTIVSCGFSAALVVCAGVERQHTHSPNGPVIALASATVELPEQVGGGNPRGPSGPTAFIASLCPGVACGACPRVTSSRDEMLQERDELHCVFWPCRSLIPAEADIPSLTHDRARRGSPRKDFPQLLPSSSASVQSVISRNTVSLSGKVSLDGSTWMR